MAWNEEIAGMGLIHATYPGDDIGWYWQRDTDWACSILYFTRAAALAARRNGTIQWEVG